MRSVRITRAFTALKKAKEKYRATVADAQATCDHPLILERTDGVSGYRYIENHYIPAVRICEHCGYVEEVRYGWPGKTTDTPLYNTRQESKSVLNGEAYKIDEDRLHKLLVPSA